MKKKLLIFLLFCSISMLSQAQTNETSANLYMWKGKKTQFQDGYLVLKSGKKLEGKISLQGSPENIVGVGFEGDGKEIDFPLTALKAYGLSVGNKVGGNSGGGKSINTGAPISDNNEELYLWRDMGTVMGKVVRNTKPRQGYVIRRDGSRLEGEFQIKELDGVISEYKLKTDRKKFKFEPAEVAHYGLLMTMAELSEKDYKDDAKNFHKGSVTLKSGEVKTGFVAFQGKSLINPNKPAQGDKYNGVFFTPSEKDYVKTFSDEEISFIVQNVDGKELTYSLYENGFVAENAMDNMSFKDVLRELNPVTLTLADGTVLTGSVSLMGKDAVNFRSTNGAIRKYEAKEVSRFDVMADGEKKAAVKIGEVLTEEFFGRNTFWVYRNPTPTTVNESATDFARSAVSLGTSGLSAWVVNRDAEKNGYETNLDSIIMSSSATQLKEIRDAFLKLQGYENSDALQENSNNESAKKYDAALNLAIVGKETRDSIVVYYEEIVFINKSTQEKYVLIDKKKMMNNKMEGLLMGCYTFLSMDKKEQKKCYDLDRIAQTAKMLDECY